jgi:ribosomal protein L34E
MSHRLIVVPRSERRFPITLPAQALLGNISRRWGKRVTTTSKGSRRAPRSYGAVAVSPLFWKSVVGVVSLRLAAGEAPSVAARAAHGRVIYQSTVAPPQYQSYVVRLPELRRPVQAGAVETNKTLPDQQLTCRNCGGPLHGREGKFVLKYFLVDRPRRRALGRR